MQARRPIALVVAAATLVACSSGGSHSAQQTSLAAPFAYDASKPLEVKTLQRSRDNGGIQVRDITFKGASGETVPAYLIVPVAKGSYPAVVYAHGSGGSRFDLILQAVAFAKQGAVAIVPEMNYSATRGASSPPAGIPGLEAKTNTEVQAVIEVRRAGDLLLSLPNVDKGRVGYLGWSAGARTGAIVAGVDHRIRAFDLLAGGAAPVSASLAYAPPNLRHQLEGLLTKTDPARYAPHATPSALLFQNGRHDEIVPHSALVRLARAGSKPKEIHWYDTGHVPGKAAWGYAQQWLSRRLGLTHNA